MAKSDWKRGRDMADGSIQYYYQGDAYNFISIHPMAIDFKGNKEWHVDTRFKSKKFQTRTQALAYANNYMRTH